MENQFFVDSSYLSPEALEKKHRLETDPSSRKNHMEYLPGMEQIRLGHVRDQVMAQMQSYDYSKRIRPGMCWRRWSMSTCSIEDFKALLIPGGGTVSGADGRAGQTGDGQAFRQHGVSVYPSCTLPITVKTTACTVGLTAITTSTA